MLSDSATKPMEDLQRVLRQKMRIYPPALAAQLKFMQQGRGLAKSAAAGSAD
jgi:hypothetical protein